jgi:uncharacterized membrane protein YkoI
MPSYATLSIMKTTFKILMLSLVLACDAGDDAGVSEAEASRAAEDAVGGDAGEIERSVEGDTEVWEVHVAMTNGATLEVKVGLDDGEIVVVEDKVGPFDYADFTPVQGVLAYQAILAKAQDEVTGDVIAWEFKRELEDGEVGFEYEFYIRDAEQQLWEIKFDATDGMATSIAAKEEID